MKQQPTSIADELDALLVNNPNAKRGEWWRWEVQTKCGPLYIDAYERWIAMRFQEPMVAHCAIGESVNYHSGKWNIHMENPSDTIEVLKRRLQQIALT